MQAAEPSVELSALSTVGRLVRNRLRIHRDGRGFVFVCESAQFNCELRMSHAKSEAPAIVGPFADRDVAVAPDGEET